MTRVALEAVRKACFLCRAVQAESVGFVDSGSEGTLLTKEDRSPVTVADFGAQAVISLALRESAPGVAIVGEETADALRTDAGRAIRDGVLRHVEAFVPEASEAQILDAIDACSDAGGNHGRRWILDPIDGTKGYLRRGQYAVALGLMEDGEMTLALLGCPSLRTHPASSGGASGAGCIFLARRGEGTVQISLDDGDTIAVHVATLDEPKHAAFCESVEAAHSAHERHSLIADRLGVENSPVRMDSQCKYGVVARGEAAIYLRLPRDESYREKIWDHAAGWLVVQEAGGRVTDVEGRELDFGRGRTLAGNRGIVATNGRLHELVLEAIRDTEPVAPAVR